MAMLMHRRAMAPSPFPRSIKLQLLQKPLPQQKHVLPRTPPPATRSFASAKPLLVTRAAAGTASRILPWKHSAPRIRFFQHHYLHPRLMSSAAQTITPMRKNQVDVQMLHPDLHNSVFPKQEDTGIGATGEAINTTPGSALRNSEPTPEMVKISVEHLKMQGLWGKEPILVPDTSLPLPPLRGRTIEDHFYNIGVAESSVYKELATKFAGQPSHPPPTQWLMQHGWTRYGKDGSVRSVPYPEEQALTFDVETVPALSKFPVMACAMSTEAWYGWVSPWLLQENLANGQQNDHHLLTFGPSQGDGSERLLIGHNVGYDRARILEEYSMELNRIRYLDTMSLHIAVSGLCTQQRPSWLKYSKAIEAADDAYLDANRSTTGKYYDVSAVNSLLQVAKFHCGIQMDKAPRNILLEAQEIGLVQHHFQDLMVYCSQDVAATHAVYQSVLPKFFKTCPHPVSFAGILQMGSSFLTVNEGWVDYIARCNKAYTDLANDVESKLLLLAQNVLDRFEASPDFYKDDPWLSQLNWEKPKREWKEGVLRKDGEGYLKGKEPRWVVKARLLPDKPEWYRQLWDATDKRIRLSTRQRIAPLLLKLQWRGYPLVFSTDHGWTFRVPREDESFQTKVAELDFPKEGEMGYQSHFDTSRYRFYRLPHKFGEGVNVGNPLAKGYIPYFEDHTLRSFATEDDTSTNLARQALDLNAQCAYWVSARERIEEQFVVWDKAQDRPGQGLGSNRMRLPDRGEGKANGIILPQIVTMGTVTRRAVEKTWMTASNAKKNRIGSELKSNVQAPAGYKIVGADVDSEELWISSLMGDAQFRMHGATALGWMTLQGTKAAGTDLHSKTASILGISRDQAKIFNYGRIYGAGLQFATRLLQQFNPAMEAAEAKEKAVTLYSATKGVKEHKEPDFMLVTDRPFWHGGSESYMFNSLERTATAEDPRTPALGCGITDALKPKHTENQFMTSRVNWVVQSSGVDYLHMLLVSMNYLIRKYDIQARFMLCVHDEVRYMVKEDDTARATLALQISNLWTRALFSYKLGIHDLPQSVAFFSSVDIDHVFRKEVNMDCLTPTQPHPIPHGTSMTIEDVVAATNGGQLGPVSPGFVDSPTDPFPEHLRTLEEKRQEEMALSMASEGLNDQALTSAHVYLEAQTLNTLKDIKQMLKHRKAEAAAAWKAKQKQAKEAQAKAAGSDDDGSGSAGGASADGSTLDNATTKQPRSRKKKSVMAISATGKKLAQVGQWGKQADPQALMEEELAKLQQQQEEAASDGGDNTDEEDDAGDRRVFSNVSSDYFTDDQGRLVKKSRFGRVVEDRWLPDKQASNGSSSKSASMMADTGSDSGEEGSTAEELATTYDDDWTMPTEEWLEFFKKDYDRPSPLLTSRRNSSDHSYLYGHHHLDPSDDQTLLSNLSKKTNSPSSPSPGLRSGSIVPRSEETMVPQHSSRALSRAASSMESSSSPSSTTSSPRSPKDDIALWYQSIGEKGGAVPILGGYSIREADDGDTQELFHDRRSNGERG